MKERNYKLIAKKGKKHVAMITCYSIEEVAKELKKSLEDDEKRIWYLIILLKSSVVLINERKEVKIMKNWLKILLQAIAAAIGAILGTGVIN